MKLLIVQPWFSAIGHPAQSLINMAEAIGKDGRVEYMIACDKDDRFFHDSAEELEKWGVVWRYAVRTSVGGSNTARALLILLRMRLQGHQYRRIFFVDESLAVLALLWPLVSPWLNVERLGVLHLFGPKLGRRSAFSNFFIRRFLSRREVRFYLRTEEMAAAWRASFGAVDSGKISYLPSLEIPDEESHSVPKTYTDKLAFGIIGQVRIGKGLEWLVPAFQAETALGRLTVAGEFASNESREQLKVLNGFDSFINRFMSESDMLERAAEQDYLLMLYDHWDRRMESAVLYLAARVNRPVVVYGDSWCGRMVREFGCGVEAPTEEHGQTLELLRSLPRPGSEAYAGLLDGMEAFRQAYSVKSLRGRVIQELLG